MITALPDRTEASSTLVCTTHPALVRDISAAYIDPLARLGRHTGRLKMIRSDDRVVVKALRDDLIREI